jgi:hypothetical protein
MGDYLGSFKVRVTDNKGKPVPSYPVVAIIDRNYSSRQETLMDVTDIGSEPTLVAL